MAGMWDTCRKGQKLIWGFAEDVQRKQTTWKTKYSAVILKWNLNKYDVRKLNGVI
jgi:hypothetical protein